jgi:hypothetical protein
MTVLERPKTHAEWRQVITQWEQSGLSIPAFAAQIGMSSSAVSYWKKRFEREPSLGISALDKTPSAFVPVTVVTEQKPQTPVADARLGAVFEVLLRDGRTLRIPSDFDAASLVRLLAVLQGNPC